MLHFAPEPAFVGPLSKLIGPGYVTADLHNVAMVRMDITHIQFPDDSFDVVYCCHVLEHVENDTQAIQELSRILKKDGWALIVVPIGQDTTHEDATINEPAGRLREFGQADHVRICGRDYQLRLEANGFIVTEFEMDAFTTRPEQERFGLSNRLLYFCTKKPQNLPNVLPLP